MTDQIETPCIGICSTIYGDDVCRGCLRRFKEVIDWNQMDVAGKQQAISRIDAVVTQVMSSYFESLDTQKLNLAIERCHVRMANDVSCWFKAYRLIHEHAGAFGKWSDIGLQVKGMHVNETMESLSQVIIEEVYQQSQ